MKKYYATLIFVIVVSCSFIQGQVIYDAPVETKPQPAIKPNIYIGPGVGANNISGMIGAIAELRVYKKFTIAGGIGVGYWGGKFSGQLRYYRRYPIGVFYGIGLSSATGMKDYEMELEVVDEEEPVNVTMDLLKVKCLNFTIGQQFKLGKRMRLNFELGYAVPMQTEFYEIKDPGVVLTEKSENQMDQLTPGGLILGVAFTFGI